jgi:hypothetical protein
VTLSYCFGSDLKKQRVICKVFDPYGSFSWYILNQDPEDPDYLWAIVKGFEVEAGSVSKKELEASNTKFGLPLDRDLYFDNKMNAEDCFNRLINGEHL